MPFDSYCVDCKKPGDDCPPGGYQASPSQTLILACTCSVGQMQSRLSSALYFEMGELTNAKPSGGVPNVPSAMGIQVAFYLL